MLSSSTSSKLMAGHIMALMMVLIMKGTDASPMNRAKNPSKPRVTDADAEMVSFQLDGSLSGHITQPLRPISNHSISPWTYNKTYDENMYPHTISEARCTYKGCLDAEGREDRTLESKPIHHQVLVLRRVKGTKGKDYHYRLESRLIAVGCTCVRPSIRRQH